MTYKGFGKHHAVPRPEQVAEVRKLCDELGVPVPELASQADADYALDDLLRMQRKRRRAG